MYKATETEVRAVDALLDLVCAQQGLENHEQAATYILHQLSEEGAAERVELALRQGVRAMAIRRCDVCRKVFLYNKGAVKCVACKIASKNDGAHQ